MSNATVEEISYLDDRDRKICTKSKKRCYPSKTQARKNRRYYELKYSQPFRMYECPSCKEWHLSKAESRWVKNKPFNFGNKNDIPK